MFEQAKKHASLQIIFSIDEIDGGASAAPAVRASRADMETREQTLNHCGRMDCFRRQ